MNNPTWWKDEHSSGWERVKAAFRRDWEQTRHDFSKKSAPELNQNVGDTLKQAAGKEAIPPGNAPNPGHDWEHHEPAARFGYGASHQYGEHKTWDSQVEDKLSKEWTGLGADKDWKEARDGVRQGWDAGRKP